MGLPDATAGAQLASSYFAAAWVAWLDFYGDPVRVTTAGIGLTFSGTGDSDLDGHTFDAVSPELVSVGDVKNSEGGSETLVYALSGIVGPDSDLLDILGDPSQWQGRAARLWAVIYDESGAQQGAVWPVHTGRMSAMQIIGSPTAQTVKLDVESYLAALKQASGRTYLDQGRFNPADNSAALKIGAANGATKGVGQGSTGYSVNVPGAGNVTVPGVMF